jgi:ATP-binding cassette subfamily B protein
MKKIDYLNTHRSLVLKYFWQVARQYKLSFSWSFIAIILASILDVYIPLRYLQLWNILSANDFTFIAGAQHAVIIILILNLFRFVIRRSAGFSLDFFISSTMAGLREQAFSAMINHSHTFFANNFGGSLTNKINKYARSFVKLTERMMVDALPLVVRGVGTVFALYILFPKYAYILGVFLILFMITAVIYIRFKLKYDVIASIADSRTTGALADSIGNHSTIQLFTGHEHEKNYIHGITQDQRKKVSFNWYLWQGLFTSQSFYTVCVEFIIFWIILWDWRIGLITLPSIVLLYSYFARLFENLWSLGSIIRAYYESFADAEEMAEILNTPYEIVDKPTEKLTSAKGEIIFENVTYIYENNNAKVLDNFYLKIPAGQKIAIVGSSGAGKTTFVRLLMRLFNLTDGKILIDGVDIKNITQKNLREVVSFVPQDPSLFHRTLMENIRYGRRNATDEEVLSAATLAHCSEFISKLPEGYKTYVGERGVKLSGGERQRVAIARAILKDSPILILDEATSSLDSISESYIQDAFNELMKGKTTIVIAHRLSTIQKMDRIIVLDEGKIMEEGTHKELLEKGGLYADLWSHQTGGFLE